MGKSTPAAPPAPDPVATAQAQAQGNSDVAKLNARLNRADQYTPQGAVQWVEASPDKWISYTTLSPSQQRLYDLQTQGQALYGQTALNQLGSAAGTLSQQMNPALANFMTQTGADQSKYGIDKVRASPDFVDATAGSRDAALAQAGGASGRAYQLAGQPINTDYNSVRQQAIDAANSRADPQFKQDEESLRSRLLSSGIPEGSEAWNNAYRQFNNSRNDFRQQTLLNAENLAGQAISQTGQLRGIPLNELGQASSLAGNYGGMAGQAQQQQLAAHQVPYQDAAQLAQLGGQAANIGNMSLQQQQALRNQTINETSALLTGQQVQTPSIQNVPQVQVAPTDYLGAQQMSQQAQQADYQAKLKAYQANLGGMYGMGSSAIIGGAMIAASDRRLKTDISRDGKTGAGVPLYQYRYKDDPTRQKYRGVMAQELMKTQPQAVVRSPNGMFAVDYAQVR